MTQLAIDGSVIPPSPYRHRGPHPIYGPRRAFTIRADEESTDILERTARARGMSLSAFCAQILEREAKAL